MSAKSPVKWYLLIALSEKALLLNCLSRTYKYGKKDPFSLEIDGCLLVFITMTTPSSVVLRGKVLARSGYGSLILASTEIGPHN